MSRNAVPLPLRVGIHAPLARSAPEIGYIVRTIFVLAGYPYHLSYIDQSSSGGEDLDVFYGPADMPVRATLRIPSARRRFPDAATLEPRALTERAGLPWLDIGEGTPGIEYRDGGASLGDDIFLASFWILVGAGEPRLRRDKQDSLHLEGAFVGRPELLSRPIVSAYIAWIREFFASRGRPPLLPPWTRPGEMTALALSHDVAYPEIVRMIEAARVLVSRGIVGLPLATRVLFGRSHFWNFREWMAFERALGARGAFYFMARRGSLVEYALGTPDAFYDVSRPRFRELFKALREEGFEIGLHASYHAHRALALLQQEKSALEEAAGVTIRGNRHRYWHLDPRTPHLTLAMHEAAHFQYDSSLAFDRAPGFRRGICHPFRPYHLGERRQLHVVQLPPAWSDRHFDLPLTAGATEEPTRVARMLLDAVRQTGGVAILNYDERGMNPDFYPRYGQWLGSFLREVSPDGLLFHRPGDLADMFETHERMLESRSRERFA